MITILFDDAIYWEIIAFLAHIVSRLKSRVFKSFWMVEIENIKKKLTNSTLVVQR